MKKVKCRNYNLHEENGSWIGQVVITSDGFFGSVTDWGNLSYIWRQTGYDDFREFLLKLNVDYFGTKMYTGMTYILYGKKCEDACKRYAQKVLPALQKALREEIDNENK